MVFKFREKDEEEWHGLLVDFDWGWKCRRSKVPANAEYLIDWADGAAPATEITKGHDPYIVEKPFVLIYDLDE